MRGWACRLSPRLGSCETCCDTLRKGSASVLSRSLFPWVSSPGLGGHEKCGHSEALCSSQVVSARTAVVSSGRHDKPRPGSLNSRPLFSPGPGGEAGGRHPRVGRLLSAEAPLLGSHLLPCPHTVLLCAHLVPLSSSCKDTRHCGSEPAPRSLSWVAP